MNRLQYLLCKLAEEASEIAQIAMKAQQFGLDSIEPGTNVTNEEKINLELNDFLAVLELLNLEYDCGFDVVDKLIEVKKERIEKFYQYSIQCGAVKDE